MLLEEKSMAKKDFIIIRQPKILKIKILGKYVLQFL